MLNEMELVEGNQYVFGTRMMFRLMPIHTDDFDGKSVLSTEILTFNTSQKVTILEVRSKKSNNIPWYFVLMENGNKGWVNAIALVHNVEEVHKCNMPKSNGYTVPHMKKKA